ncbi:unnamed protein product, partial [Mesorhabditis spiculigera]
MNYIQHRNPIGRRRDERKDDSLPNPSTSLQASPPVPTYGKNEDPLASALLGAAEMTSKLCIVHPCNVLRRQCQVHQHANSLHLTPVTLVPVIFNLTNKQGILTLWKGSIGNGVLWGLTSITEIVLSDVCGLPNESGLGEGDSENRVMEVIVKGVDRMRFFAFGARDSSRRFSILHLALPTVAFRTSHYLVQTGLYHYLFNIARRYVNRKPESERTKFHEYVPQIFAQMTSSVCTDMILFPFETILHRMYIQGTRTLIDNLDSGLSAASITIKYSGFFDCLRQTVEREGFWALYAGAGALFLEYMLQSTLHQVARAIFDRGSEALLRRATHAHLATTPPISHAANLDTIGPLSGPLASQQLQQPSAYQDDRPVSMIGSPHRGIPISAPSVPFPTASPPLLASPTMVRAPQPRAREALSFPSFGETSGSYGSPNPPTASPFGNPPHQPPKSSIFGRNASAGSGSSWEPLPPLHLDTNNQFS